MLPFNFICNSRTLYVLLCQITICLTPYLVLETLHPRYFFLLVEKRPSQMMQVASLISGISPVGVASSCHNCQTGVYYVHLRRQKGGFLTVFYATFRLSIIRIIFFIICAFQFPKPLKSSSAQFCFVRICIKAESKSFP